MKIKAFFSGLLILLAAAFSSGVPAQAAAAPKYTTTISGDCQTWFTHHGSYQVSSSAKRCYVTVQTNVPKVVRTIQVQIKIGATWKTQTTLKTSSKGTAKATIDTSCTNSANQCAGRFTYRLLLPKVGSYPQLVLKTFALSQIADKIVVPPVLSSDVSLASWTVNGVGVSSGSTVNVANGTTSVLVLVLATNANAYVQVTGDKNLVEGANYLKVKVTAQDGVSVREYTVTVIVASFDYEGAIRDFYYDLSHAPDVVSFVDEHTDPTYFDKSNPQWDARKKILSKYHKYWSVTPVAGTARLDPNWRWGAGTCHPAMTSAPAGKTYIVTLQVTEGADLQEPVSMTQDLHLTISPSGKIYIYNDICMWNFGLTVLLDKTIVENSIKSVYAARGISLSPNCPDPMYGKVGEKRICTFTYSGTMYQVEVTIQDLLGTIAWITKT